MLLVDAHLDLSLNALEWNRDLRLPLAEVRELEAGKTDLKGRGCGVASFPEMRRAEIGLCVATQIGGCMKPAGPVATWESPQQAWCMTQAQRLWYEEMEKDGWLRGIRDLEMLEQQLKEWEADPEHCPLGYILSLEGADSLVTLDYLETAWGHGLRAIGPAHYGVGRYALGHDQDGPLPPVGKDLLREMDRLGMILDVTHLCDQTLYEALELYTGPVWASHSNCRSLVNDVRQFSDEQIQLLIQRGAVIGAVLDTWMVIPNWVRGVTTPEETGVMLEHVVDHMDHICQLAGNANHIMIGSDLDGGYGKEQVPLDVDSIADLQKLTGLLEGRGFRQSEIEGIFHGNFLRFLRDAWTL